MLAAMAEAVAEVGYARVTVSEIIARAGVSRNTFYNAFADREGCFLALLEETVSQAAILVGGAYIGKRHWRAGVRSALGRLLTLMDHEPALARLWIVEAPSAGETALEHRAHVLDELAKVIGAGGTTSAGYDPPELVAEGIVGGAFAILHTRLLRADRSLTELLGPLMYMIVLPYLGERVARSELDRPAPKAPSEKPTRAPIGRSDPLAGLRMRLTYRTVRVLVAIGDRPGASNRGVAEVAGIADQGQISKLLRRLAKLELVENHGLGQDKGAANAWHLTRRGEQVVRATRPSVSGLF
jgi:AcrR family transcriptional regulator/DNA-binding MarR family transcriptional regulator